MSDRDQILTYLRGLLEKHHAKAPPVTGGMPSPAHNFHWARTETLDEVIAGIEQQQEKPETFPWNIEFKDSDGCGEFAYWADEDKRRDLETTLEADGEDIEKAGEILYEDPKATSKKFFEHGEYGNVELKLRRDGTGTVRLVPQDEG